MYSSATLTLLLRFPRVWLLSRDLSSAVVLALAAMVACMLEAGWFNVVLLVCECLWLVPVACASWVRGSRVAPLALFVCKVCHCNVTVVKEAR